MRPTIAKQIIIPTSSRHIIGSFSHIRAIMEIQNGYVCQLIIVKDIGAIDTAEVTKKKLIWPAQLRTNNAYFFYHGKSFTGLYPFIQHHTTATGNPARVRSMRNSTVLKPFSDYFLNRARVATPVKPKRFYAKIDKHLLSFFSSFFIVDSVLSSGSVSTV